MQNSPANNNYVEKNRSLKLTCYLNRVMTGFYIVQLDKYKKLRRYMAGCVALFTFNINYQQVQAEVTTECR